MCSNATDESHSLIFSVRFHTCTTKLFYTVNHFFLPIKGHPINAENRATSVGTYLV